MLLYLYNRGVYMKRIKRIFCLSLVIVSALVLCACSKDYNSITYKRFTEKMGNELNYAITDNTLIAFFIRRSFLLPF